MPFTWKRPSEHVEPAAAIGPPAAFVPAGAAPPESDGRSAEQQDAGRLLVQLLRYLEQHAIQHPALMPVIGRLGDAVAEYRMGQSADPYAGVRAVVAAIQRVRASDPSLPEP